MGHAPGPGVRFLLILGALTALTPASIDMHLPSFPERAYLVGLAAGQAVYGPPADRMAGAGHCWAGLARYAVASAGCALAPRIDVLIAHKRPPSSEVSIQ